ncbi:MAG TPA: penicillin-binding transpeptidase domain-containing protein [Candidatus Acidoferrales bacterium]|jgi:penicillin-binding protein 2|nr:penicillin-binding transpeptidase domain-containing protein [Candidatus Acidoferrales bacterium]
MKKPLHSLVFRLASFALALHLIAALAFGAIPPKRKRHRPAAHRVAAHAAVAHVATVPIGSLAVPIRKVSGQTARRMGPVAAAPAPAAVIAGGPWTQPTYADSTDGDNIDGEDMDVRRIAVEALGQYNGSVVVVDSATGRVLSMVNQKLALGSGFQPCSTVKVSVALAGLSEKVIQPETKYRVHGMRMDLTYALAHSNNYYFATLGEKLGFERVSYYSRLFGYGEKAGLNIAGEQPGHYPSAPPKNGGMGMLTSFGEEIQQTPLQLAALMSAIANGGTLYYLQYPRTAEDGRSFVPRVKRRLDIESLIPVVKPGMRGAVEFGTAHRAREDGVIAGKTGTCSENHTHLGWFGSFNDVGNKKLVVVVLLTGGRPAIGPLAAGIAGDVYRRLGETHYIAAAPTMTPATLISSQICCK